MRRFIEAVLRFLREADMLLLVLSIISSVYGILLISSVVRGGGESGLTVQIGSVILGIALFVLFSYIDIDTIADKSTILLIASAMFISTLFFWGYGDEVGSTAWLRFGGIGIQPAEIVKIPFIIIIARMIVNYKERKSLNTPLALIMIFLVFALLFGLIIFASSDLGSALVYFFILIVMLFIGGIKLRWFFISAGALAAVSPLIWTYFLADYQKARILAPFSDAVEARYTWHAAQSRIAIASGGFSGQGLYNGRMTQAGVIPAQRTDFIFSAAGEELGFIGCTVIILMLTIIIIRCIYVGVKSNNSLGLLVCTGIGAMLIAQTIENIGMCLGLLPVVGITLPFFSYGGSSIVTSFAAMGIISGVKMRPKPIRFRNM